MANEASLFGLKWKDAFKGFVVAFLSAFLTALLKFFEGMTFPTLAEFKTVALVGLIAGISYLIKNFFTNSQDQLLTKEPDK